MQSQMQRRAAPQDITWFLDLKRNGQLDLDPPYQRKSVWNLKDRQFFLDTVFRNYPCPPIFLHQSKDENGKATYHVVDGKQRLETIIKFTNNEFSLGESLKDLNLHHKKWNDLAAEEKRILWNYIFTVEFLPSPESLLIDEVFTRINTNSRKLEPQELRHAKYDGWFVNFIESESEKEEWKRLKVVTAARAKRMKDAQFLSELYLVVLNNQIIGFDQDLLDLTYATYDDPQTTIANFSEEEFVEKSEAIKSYILYLEDYNSCVTRHARTFANFYSLWAFVALNLPKLPQPSKIAERYATFMENTAIFNKEQWDKLQDHHEEVSNETLKSYVKYYVNLTGASTDLSPRLARHEALMRELLNGHDEDPPVSS